MKRRPIWLAFLATATFASVALAQSGPTEDSLKLAHQTLASGIASGNPAMVVPILHRSGVGFYRDSQLIVRLGGSYGPEEAIPTVLADLGRFMSATYETVFRVAGTTGVVCSASNLQPKKGENVPPRFIRGTWTYAFIDGAWRLLAWHSSDIPLKK